MNRTSSDIVCSGASSVSQIMTLCTIARNHSGLLYQKMVRHLFIRQFEVDALATPHQLGAGACQRF
jgi:hypothetical protein